MKTTYKIYLYIISMAVFAVPFWPGLVIASEQQPLSIKDSTYKHFKIQVVDRQTGRGVPLVELRTVNNIRYFTDSNGIVAFYEPGLMNREVFFFVKSHGYEFPKDGFDIRGTRLKTSSGGSAVIKIDRINIAERLYRITGQGIYRDSILTGTPVPLKEPVLNGQVMGQDSVFTCFYNGRLFWMWGDTARPSYPLGNFAVSGALSDLPEHGGLNPDVGINLEYFVDENGFSKKMCPMKEPGLIWLDGLITLKDNEGRQRMVAKYARLKDMGNVQERGLVAFNDKTQSFEPLVRSDPDFLPYPDPGHAINVNVDGQEYFYFATPFPLAVRMRVRAKWDDVINPNYYEALTFHQAKQARSKSKQRLDLSKDNKAYRWVSFAELLVNEKKQSVIEALKKEKENVHLYDIETGKQISPHNGTVYFNNYRKRWVSIFVQQYGDSSFLGEVWYAEADTPVGPWAYARKIATHNKYSFYNPKHHQYFDQDNGRALFFEGTYSYTFSGSAENATPLYDYNQIMYRLNLDDKRLALPVTVYQIRDKQGEINYLLRDNLEKAGKWDLVESIPFYAIEPARAHKELIPVYTSTISGKNAQMFCLTVNRHNESAKPLFYALPPTHTMNKNSHIAPLYEYRHIDTGQCIYLTTAQLNKKDWTRAENPLCRVWETPTEPLLLDSKAKPTLGY